jgi:hypothetical protein
MTITLSTGQEEEALLTQARIKLVILKNRYKISVQHREKETNFYTKNFLVNKSCDFAIRIDKVEKLIRTLESPPGLGVITLQQEDIDLLGLPKI